MSCRGQTDALTIRSGASPDLQGRAGGVGGHDLDRLLGDPAFPHRGSRDDPLLAAPDSRGQLGRGLHPGGRIEAGRCDLDRGGPGRTPWSRRGAGRGASMVPVPPSKPALSLPRNRSNMTLSSLWGRWPCIAAAPPPISRRPLASPLRCPAALPSTSWMRRGRDSTRRRGCGIGARPLIHAGRGSKGRPGRVTRRHLERRGR